MLIFFGGGGSLFRAACRAALFFFFFLGPQPQHMKVPSLGVESELQLSPTLQPQQHRIGGTSVTSTTAHGNARSLTH